MKKIAIVTGASSGLGRAISLELAKNNFFVILSARSITGLKKTQRKIKINKGECIIIKLDITERKSIELFKKKVDKIGSPNVIVNNAGIGIFNKIENTTIQEWDMQLAVNLTGPYLMTKVFVDDMKKNKKGTIIFINSTAGIQGYPNSSAYVASKHGLKGFAKSLREELRLDNIRVISIYPGAIDTPLWDDNDVKFTRSEMMTAKEVASTVLHAIEQNNIAAIEDIVLRRVKGDF